jgi:UPF0755 protein
MRPLRVTLLAAAMLLMLFLGLALDGAWRQEGVSSGPDTLLLVPEGASSRAIIRQMSEAGVLVRPRIFLWGLRLNGAADELRAGRYRLRRPSSPARLLATLRAGETEKIWLTLPEGLWLDEAVGQIATQLELDSLDLARRVRRPRDWSHPFLEGAKDLEGFLLPDTYAFEYPADPVRVIGTLLDAFDTLMTELQGQVPEDWRLGSREWATLSSIVEAEARLDDERPAIAAVYLNRVARGMKLEADPTVIYGLGFRKPRLYYKDLDLDSPYNTYRHTGLPPGPICSPGRASLAALPVADPNDPNLYFVADGSGGHLFAETFSEHLRNVDRVRRGNGKP